MAQGEHLDLFTWSGKQHSIRTVVSSRETGVAGFGGCAYGARIRCEPEISWCLIPIGLNGPTTRGNRSGCGQNRERYTIYR